MYLCGLKKWETSLPDSGRTPALSFSDTVQVQHKERLYLRGAVTA